MSGGSIQSGSPRSQRSLPRSTSDLTQRQSNAVYDLRPQGNSGAHTGQLVAKSRTSPKNSAPKPSPAEELLAAVDADVKAAAKMLKNGESREVVLLLQKAYRKADSADPKTCEQTAMLARASVRLQLAGVYSVLSRHREAIEEAVSSMLEADAAWKSMLSESDDLSARASSSEAPVPEAAFRSLLINPPPWLARTAETSVLARCCAAGELQKVVLVDDAVAVEDANREATGLLEEAEMLARHFLPQDHPARNASKRALRRQVTGFDTSADSWFSKHTGTLADARLSLSMSQDQLQSWRAAQDSQLPPLSGLQSRQRLPPSREGVSSFGASPPGTAATFASSPPPSTALSVTFHDQEQEQGLFAVPPPEIPPSQPVHHPAAPSSGWTGRCPAGDVYVSSLPKQKLPRLSASRKKKKEAVELSEAQAKRAEGAAGGLDQATAALILPAGPPPNAFQDWLGSFEGAAYDIKRDVIRNEEAAQRIKKGLHDKGLSFKTRYLGSLSETDLFEDRTVFCGYGLRATRIGEKMQEKRAKQLDSSGGIESEYAVEKRTMMNDLFKFYRVDPGKSEPDLRTLGNLLKQSAPGQDRRNRKQVTQKEQTLSSMKSLFGGLGGSGGLLGKKADDDNSPEVCSTLGAGLSGALKRSSTMASPLARPGSK